MSRRVYSVEMSVVAAMLATAIVLGAAGPAQAQLSLGDMNCDGRIDGLDVQPFVDCLLSGGNCNPPCIHIAMDTVPIGNPGNPGDTRYPAPPITSFGGVAYAYHIGKYEVTAGQYTQFLNAVAATDTYGLYNLSMSTDTTYGCRIQRSGASGSYTYACSAGAWANRPVNYVSWGDAARFANWLHNGQPTGPQGPATTEDGAYLLNGATTNAALMLVTRKPGAKWAIPTEDEWYKAAYHKNDGVTGNYWDYPTRTNTAPNNGNPGGDTGNSANFYAFPGNGFAVGPLYYRTEPAYFSLSASPYGTFDQGGNVWEWNEANISGSYRGVRGGSFITSDSVNLHASYYYYSFSGYGYPTSESGDVGFRVVEVP